MNFLLSQLLVFLLAVYGRRCEEPCSQEALNNAADLTLYYIEQNITEFMEIPDINQVIASGMVRFTAKGGYCGGIRSLARTSDYYTDFSDELSDDKDKPTLRKIVMGIQGEFRRLYVHFNTSEIVLGGCRSQGSVRVSLHRSLFEIVAQSSDKHGCLMDLKLLKFHRFGPIHVRIDPAEGWFCAAITQALFNFIVKFFNSSTKKKIRENILLGVRQQFALEKDLHVCLLIWT